jgi:hypothetical protein
VSADLVPQYVHVAGRTLEVPSVAPAEGAADGGPQASGGAPDPQAGATRRVPLGRLAGARSGDKGGDANLGVFTRSDAAFAWLDGFLTEARLADLLPEIAPLTVERYSLPNLRALNFVIRGLLEEGVAASSRIDAQAKSLGEWLRARHVDIPADLLPP